MTDRQDRLIFSLAMAVSVMIHAAVLWGVSWQEHEALPPQRHSVTPLQLILLPREQSSVEIPVKKEGRTVKQSEEEPMAQQQHQGATINQRAKSRLFHRAARHD